MRLDRFWDPRPLDPAAVRLYGNDTFALVLAALYEGNVLLDGAHALMREVAGLPWLPQACVLDAGFIEDRGWAIVEANAAWGAGLNGCDAAKVLPAIAAATRIATSR